MNHYGQIWQSWTVSSKRQKAANGTLLAARDVAYATSFKIWGNSLQREADLRDIKDPAQTIWSFAFKDLRDLRHFSDMEVVSQADQERYRTAMQELLARI